MRESCDFFTIAAWCLEGVFQIEEVIFLIDLSKLDHQDGIRKEIDLPHLSLIFNNIALKIELV